MVYPAFGVVYSKGITGFSDLDPHQRRHDGDRNALWLFLISIHRSNVVHRCSKLYVRFDCCNPHLQAAVSQLQGHP